MFFYTRSYESADGVSANGLGMCSILVVSAGGLWQKGNGAGRGNVFQPRSRRAGAGILHPAHRTSSFFAVWRLASSHQDALCLGLN